jgi:hypothetical protein
MLNYRSVSMAIGPSIQAGITRLWPPKVGMMPGQPVSLTALCDRFSAAGEALEAFERKSAPGLWKHLQREAVAQTLRARLVDPALIDQANAGLCGPMSILVELARRDPLQYVVAAAELFDEGRYCTLGGKVIVAEAELREVEPSAKMAAVDWLLGASFRDDENIWEDVDRGTTEFDGLETLTTPWEMAEWTREVLGLDSGVESCISYGEIAVLRECEEAVQNGGVAFLCVDGAVINPGPGDTEEDVWFTRRSHREGGPNVVEPVHSRDDGLIPTHWILHLGGMQLNESSDKLILPVWSWASEFTVSGSAKAFGEYLYYGVIGRPR